jgi:hypothetical protein
MSQDYEALEENARMLLRRAESAETTLANARQAIAGLSPFVRGEIYLACRVSRGRCWCGIHISNLMDAMTGEEEPKR